MLHAMGFADEELPRLLVHGWWNVAGAKMSKSLGNVIDPDILADKYGADALRYYLMRDNVVGQDSDFSEERLLVRYTSDLANGLGNLVNRTINMSQRYRAGILTPASIRDADLEALQQLAGAAMNRYREAFERFEVQNAIEAAWELVTKANTLVEQKAPWKLAKQPEYAELLDAVLYALAETVRLISLMMSPVTPRSSSRILEQLQSETASRLEWGGLPAGHRVGAPQPIFPK